MRRQTNRYFHRQEKRRTLSRGERILGKHALAFEPLEQRTLLSATSSLFLQGTAFWDVNANGVLDDGDIYKGSSSEVPAATIQLYDSTGTLLAETATDVNGAYRFDSSTIGVDNNPLNLTPDTYRIVEVPPAGFANETVQILSQLYPATAVGLNTIEVTLLASSNLYAHYDARGAGRTDEVDNTGSGFAGQLKIHVDETSTTTSPSTTWPQFLTLCSDITSTVAVGNTFQVVIDSSSSGTSGLGVNAGRIAYLFNHYGTASLTNDEAAALQVAIWELVNDVTPDLTSGNFQLISPQSIAAQANSYLSESAGKSEVCIVLNAVPTDETDLHGRQDMLATESYNFANVVRTPVTVVISPDKSPSVPQQVKVINEATGEVLAQFTPYESNFVGGIRIVTGDINGDGIDEIITAPGRGRAPEIRVFTQNGTELTKYRTMAYDSSYMGGVQLAVGDVNGDGLLDIVTVPTFGAAQVRAFLNQPSSADPIQDTPSIEFLAFSSAYLSGGVVAVADMGSLAGGAFTNTLDGKAEIIVGSGAGMASLVEVFDVSGSPTMVQSFVPFSASFEGGVSLSTARIDADPIPDIVVGAGVNGDSNVEIWTWNTGTGSLSRLGGFAAFTGAGNNAPVHLATQDIDGDGIAETILAVQGANGMTPEIRIFTILNTSPFQIQQETPLAGFSGPLFVAALDYVAISSTPKAPSVNSGTSTPASPQPSSVGVYDPATSVFLLRDTTVAGGADICFAYGAGNSGWLALVGDWNGDGVDTVGLYDPVTSKFYLRNSNTTGYADVAFTYGAGDAGWTPLVGDWDGDGVDTIGLYDSTTGKFYFRNTNSTGYADIAFTYGMPGWTPIVGDWDGDGDDTIGLYYEDLSMFFLRNTNTTGFADTAFAYGPASAGWLPLVSDSNGDGVDTIGLYDPKSSMFYLKNANKSGYADTAFLYGTPGGGLLPVAGVWNKTSPLFADEAVTESDAAALTQDKLDTIVAAAIANWASVGLSQDAQAILASVQFTIADLSGSLLGLAGDGVVVIDVDAAGNGWFVDSTPLVNEEFAATEGASMQAVSADAVDRIDLLTVVEHELGHILGLDDEDATADSLMSGVLGTGVRRDVERQCLDAIFASA